MCGDWIQFDKIWTIQLTFPVFGISDCQIAHLLKKGKIKLESLILLATMSVHTVGTVWSENILWIPQSSRYYSEQRDVFKIHMCRSTNQTSYQYPELCGIKGAQWNPCFHVPLYKSVPIHFPNFRNKLLTLEYQHQWLAASHVCFLFALTRETVSEYLWCEDRLWFEMGA